MLSSLVVSKRPRGSPKFTYGRGLMKSLKKANVAKCSWHDLANENLVVVVCFVHWISSSLMYLIVFFFVCLAQ